MKRYTYKAFYPGSPPISGKLSAESPKDASLRLRSKGFCIIRIREEKRSFLRAHPYRNRKKLSLFCREWSSLLAAGLPLTETIAILSSHENPRAAAILKEAAAFVETGMSLTDSFQATGEFPHFFLSMLAVGEMSGTLPDELHSLAAYYEKEDRLRKKLIAATAYPLFLLFFSLLVFLLILLVILPSFTQLFESLSLPMPAVTQTAVSLGGILSRRGPPFLLAVLVILPLLFLWMRTPRGRLARDRLFLHSLFIRRLLLIRFCHTLSALLKSGAPLSEALRQTASVTKNEEARRRILSMSKRLSAGGDFPDTLRKSGLSMPFLTQMAASGMKSGELPRFMNHAARLMTEDTEQKMERFKTILEPSLILLAGFVTASLLFTVMIPIFTAIGRGF